MGKYWVGEMLQEVEEEMVLYSGVEKELGDM